MESLYGALFDVGVQKKGERQLLRFSMEVVNDDYLAKQGILAQAFYFLNRVINRPVLEDGGFKKDYVAQEKENMKNRIRSLVNDKVQYSLERCAQEMCKGEKYSRYVFGDIEELDGLDSSKLYNVYREIIQSSPLDVFVVGDVDPEKVRLLLERSLSMDRKGITAIPKTIYRKLQVVPKTVEEEMDVNQGKLVMGFRTNINAADEEYFPLVVYGSVLGGGPHSKLFMNVREKASLAYYAFARLEKFKGLMFVGAGIDFEKYDQTVNIIMEQLEAMAKGQITPQEFEGAINALVTSLKGSMDQPSQLIDYYLGNSVMDSDLTLEELIDRIKGVTVDQVVEVSRKLKLDTVYFLRNRKRGYVVHEKGN